jgi:hypothetical protein
VDNETADCRFTKEMSFRQGKFAYLILIKPGKHLAPTKYKSFVTTVYDSERVQFFKLIILLLLLLLLLLTAIGLSPGGSGYFTCIQNMKLVTNRFKSGGLHEKHVVATWNVGNRLSVCL